LKSLIENNLISTRQASDLSGYNADYLTRMCRAGKIQGEQVGRTWVLSRQSLEAFVKVQSSRKNEIREQLSKSREKEYKQAQVPSTVPAVQTTSKKVLSPIRSLVPVSAVKSFFDSQTFASRGLATIATLLILLTGVTAVQAARETTIVPSLVARASEVHVGVRIIADASIASVIPAHASLAIPSPSSLLRSASFATVKTFDTALYTTTHPIQTIASFATDSVITTAHSYLAYAAFTHSMLDTYDRAIFAWTAATPVAARIAIASPYVVGDVLASAAGSVPSSITRGFDRTMAVTGNAEYGTYTQGVSGVRALATAASSIVNGPHDASVAIATTSTATVALAAPHSLAALHDSIENTLLGVLGYSALEIDVARKSGGMIAANIVHTAGSSLDQTAAAVVPVNIHSIGETLALITYRGLSGLVNASSSVIATILTGRSTHIAVVPTINIPAPTGSQGSGIAYVPPTVDFGGSNFGQNTTNTGNSTPTIIYQQPIILSEGASKQYVDSQIQLIHESLLAQIDASTRGLGGGGITVLPTSYSGISVNSSTFDGDSISSSTFDGGTISSSTLASIKSLDVLGTTTLALLQAGDTTLNTLTVGTSTFSGPVTVNSNLTVTGLLNAGSLAVSDVTSYGTITAPNFNATSTSATSTFAGSVDIGNGDLTYSTSTRITAILNALIQNLIATNATTTNATTTNAYATNLLADNALLGTATITNATSTNFFASLLSATTGIFTNLSAQLATIAGLNVTNSTTTNATTTNEYATNSTIANLVATNASLTNATSTNSFATNGIVTNLVATNATSTNFFASLLTATSGIFTNFTAQLATIAGLNVTNSTTTNATSTNTYATNSTIGTLLAGTGTFTSATTTNLYAASGTIDSLISGNSTIQNLAFTNATGTALVLTQLTTGAASVTGDLAVGGNERVTGTSTVGALSVGALNGFLKATAGAISTSLVNLTTDVSGILPVINGGTGTSSFATNGVLYGNNTNGLLTTAQGAANTVLVANNGAPIFSDAITIGTSVTTPTVNATTAYLFNGANINTGGTLSNVAYLDRANTFTNTNTYTQLQNFNGGINSTNSALGIATATSLAVTTLTASTSTFTNTLATYATSTNATSTNFFGSFANFANATATNLFAISTNLTNATTTTLNAGTFGLNNSYFSSLTGTGLLNSGGALAVTLAPFTTTNLAEGTNLYYTDARAQAAISVDGTTPLTYNTGVIGLHRASLTQDGYLAASDFATFNNKISSTSLSATGPLAYDPSTGVFSLGVVDQAHGGTGFTTYTTGDILYADNTGTLQKLPEGGNGQVLQIAAGLPAWGSVSVNSLSGGDGIFATSTSIIYPLDISRTLIIGGSSTSTPNSIFEVHGQEYVATKLGIGTTSPSTALSVAGNGLVSGTFTLGNIIDTGVAANSLLYLNGAQQASAVSITTPLTFTSGTLAINQSSRIQSGYLSAADFVTFDNKISSTSLSATGPLAYNSSTGVFSLGTVGVANGGTGSTTLTGILKGNGTGSVLTAVAGTDYQVPFTAGTGLSFAGNTLNSVFTQSGANIYNNNSGNVGIGTTTPGTKLSVAGAGYFMGGIIFGDGTTQNTAAANYINSVSSPLTVTAGNLSIPQASSVSNGYLASTDWNTFNNKQAAITAGTGLSFAGNTLNSVFTQSGANIYNNNSGNVGIGTSNPLALLSVGSTGSISDSNVPVQISAGGTGQAYFGANNNGSYGLVVGYSNNGAAVGGVGAVIDNLSNTPLTLGTNSTARETILANGNVGIGTTNPQGSLQVAGQTSGSLTVAGIAIGNQTNFATEEFYNTSGAIIDFSGTSGRDYDFRQLFAPSTNSYSFVSSSSPSLFTLLGNGNVGIGESNPSAAKLVVESNAGAANQLALINTSSGTGPASNSITFGRSQNATHQTASILSDISGTGNFAEGYLAFQTETGGALTERMRITNGGNVGIGTTSPQSKLEVDGTDSASFQNNTPGVFRIGGTGTLGNYTSLDFVGTGGGLSPNQQNLPLSRISSRTTGIGTYLNFGTSGVYTNGITNTAMTIDPSGNVGIGTTTPVAPLDVYSTATPTYAYSAALLDTLYPSEVHDFAVSPSSGSNQYVGNLTQIVSNAGSSYAGTVYGGYDFAYDLPTYTANQNSLISFAAKARHQGTGTLATLYGGQFVANDRSAGGTITAEYGLQSTANTNTGAGATSTNLYGIQATASNGSNYGGSTVSAALDAVQQNNALGSLVTGSYGLKVEDLQNSAGTIANTYGVYVGSQTNGTQTNHPYSFYAADTSAYNYFGGSVGIGTTAPGQKLTVRTGAIRLDNSDFAAGTTGTFLDTSLGATSGNTYASIQNWNSGGAAAGALALNPVSGNVGVGTTSPSQALSVSGTGYFTGGVRFGDGTTQTTAATSFISSVTSPLSVTSGVLSISQASSLSNGYLSSSDWNTFNNKQAAITAGTGLSFAGNTLNSVWTSSGGNIYNNTGTSIGIDTTAINGVMTINAGTDRMLNVRGDPASFGTSQGGIILQGVNSAQSAETPITLEAGKLYLNPGGNTVGVGTLAPLAQLSIGSGSLADSNVPVQISTGAAGTASYYGANKNGGYGVLFGYGNGVITTGGQIREVTADPLSVIVNNTTVAETFLSTGNVGIGVTSPQSRLNVLSASNVATPDLLFTFDGAGNYRNGISNAFYGGSAANNIMRFSVSDGTLAGQTAVMTLLGNGNVGIGTATPNATLSLGGSIQTIKLAAYDGGASALYGIGVNSSELTFGANIPANGTPQMVLTSTGNVGIGTAAPNSKLDVVGAISLNGGLGNASTRPAVGASRIAGEVAGYGANGYASDDGFLRLSAGGGTSAGTKSYIDVSGYSTQSDMNDNIVFGTASTERMRINSSGNVGIGITTPDALLTVNGNISFASASGNSTKGLYWYGNANGAWGELYRDASTGKMYLDSQSGVSLAINANNTSGNVGIGTASPGYKLDVNGNVNVGGKNLYLGGVSRINDTTSAGYTDIQPQNNALILYDAAHDQSFSVYNAAGSSAATLYQTGNLSILNNNSAGYLELQSGSGNVGIGTAGPQSKLEVFGAENIFPTSNYTTAATAKQLTIGEATNNSAYRLSLGYYYDSAYGYDSVVQGTQSSVGSRLLLNPIGGSVGINTTAPGYQLDVNGTFNVTGIQYASGHTFGQYSAGYNYLYDGSANAALILGGTSDPTNYYRNTTHSFGSISGAATYATINSTGTSLGGAYGANGTLDVNTGAANNHDGIVMYQSADNTNTIQTYIDNQWSARTTYAGGCCNLLKINPDIGDVQIGPTLITHAGGLSGVTTLGMNGALSGVTTLQMGGALSGVTTLSMSAGLSGVTTIAMNGALSGVTSLNMNGNLTFANANPSIITGGSYIQVPSGEYINGGTLYVQNQAQFRGGLHNDNAGYLELDGGVSGYTYVNGGLGVGNSVTSPNNVLQVNGATNSNQGLSLTSNDSHALLLSSSFGSSAYNGIFGAGDQGIMFNAGSPATGSFDIGPWTNGTYPTTGLHMSNTGIVTFNQNGNTCTVTPGTGLSCSSDQRLKNSIAPINVANALSTINQTVPVFYHLNTEASSTLLHAGFIAQAIQQIYPELVTTDTSGNLQLNYTGFVPYLVAGLQQEDIKVSALASSTSPFTFSDAGTVGFAAASTTQLSIAGNISATGTVSSKNVAAGDVNATGTVSAATVSANTYQLNGVNSSTPSEVLTASGTAVDLAKFTNYSFTRFAATASSTDSLTTRMASLEFRVTTLEGSQISTTSLAAVVAGIQSESTTTSGFSTSTIVSMLSDLGILIEKGIAQFNTLVVRDLVFSKDSNGSSAAGSGTILSGNTTVEIDTDHMLSGSQVSVTLTSPMSGNWYVTDKKNGSFRVTLSAAQSADVTFDYLIVQTQGQIATSTPIGATNTGSFSISSWLASLFGGAAGSNSGAPVSGQSGSSSGSSTGGANGGTSGSGTTPTPAPSQSGVTVTLTGAGAVSVDQGGAFIDPGATATDASSTDISSSIVVSGSVDTNTPGMYTVTYTATDASGGTGSASRVVSVVASAAPAPTTPSAPATPAPSAPSTASDSSNTSNTSSSPASSDPASTPAPADPLAPSTPATP
jgi:hypothetical protein